MKQLPDLCYYVLPGTGELIVLKSGESGYFKSDFSTENIEINYRTARKMNAGLGVESATVEAMYCGSLFGWDLPIADPDQQSIILAKIKENGADHWLVPKQSEETGE